MTPWRRLFQALPDKDRQRLQYLTVAVLCILLWFWNISPALQIHQQAPLQLAKLEQQSETLKAQQLQAMALQKAPRINAQDASAVLPQIMASTLGSGAKLNLDATRVTVTMSSVSAEALAQFLEEARTQAHALPTEVHLQKIKAGTQDVWRGTLMLNLPSQ